MTLQDADIKRLREFCLSEQWTHTPTQKLFPGEFRDLMRKVAWWLVEEGILIDPNDEGRHGYRADEGD